MRGFLFVLQPPCKTPQPSAHRDLDVTHRRAPFSRRRHRHQAWATSRTQFAASAFGWPLRRMRCAYPPDAAIRAS